MGKSHMSDDLVPFIGPPRNPQPADFRLHHNGQKSHIGLGDGEADISGLSRCSLKLDKERIMGNG